MYVNLTVETCTLQHQVSKSRLKNGKRSKSLDMHINRCVKEDGTEFEIRISGDGKRNHHKINAGIEKITTENFEIIFGS